MFISSLTLWCFGYYFNHSNDMWGLYITDEEGTEHCYGFYATYETCTGIRDYLMYDYPSEFIPEDEFFCFNM